jgi:hypothetical protein
LPDRFTSLETLELWMAKSAVGKTAAFGALLTADLDNAALDWPNPLCSFGALSANRDFESGSTLPCSTSYGQPSEISPLFA